MKPISLGQETSDALIAVLEVHFQRTEIVINSVVRVWSENGANQEQYENAINYIFRAIHQPREEFVALLNEEFGDVKSGGLKKSYDVLDMLSRQFSGNVSAEDDILFQHCRQVSGLSTPDLQQVMSDYLKSKSDEFLREEYFEMYQRVKKELAAEGHLFAIDVANDLEVPSSSVRASSPAAKLSSEEKRTELG